MVEFSNCRMLLFVKSSKTFEGSKIVQIGFRFGFEQFENK